MLAAVLKGPYSVAVEEVGDPRPGPGWAVVESRAVGICGTDKAFYRGTYRLLKEPLIPGHEVSGVVVDGPEDLVGERVVSEINFSCLRCLTCRRGYYTHCPYRSTLGITTDGGMAERFAAPSWALHRHRLNHDVAFAAEPLAAVIHAVETTPPAPGDLVAVVGAGFIAHLLVQVLRPTRARIVVVARGDSPKKGYFRGLGVDVVSFEEAGEIGASEGLDGLGYDLVFEATGTNEGIKTALRLARPRGVVHLKSTPGGEASFSQTEAVVKEVTIATTRCGDSRDFRKALRLLEEGAVKPVVTGEYSLPEAAEAFKASIERRHMKVLVKP